MLFRAIVNFLKIIRMLIAIRLLSWQHTNKHAAVVKSIEMSKFTLELSSHMMTLDDWQLNICCKGLFSYKTLHLLFKISCSVIETN